MDKVSLEVKKKEKKGKELLRNCLITYERSEERKIRGFEVYFEGGER